MSLKIIIAFLCCAFLSPFGLAADAPRNPNLPTLWIIGDSTVKNGSNGLVGWGEKIGDLFDPTKINVENRAIGGRSSRSFRGEGRWQQVLDQARPGDFVLMQFGHNDSGPLDDERARGSLRGMGEETKDVIKKDGTRETVHTFGWYMEQYIKEAKDKGMTPIVCSYIPRCPRPGSHGEPATMPSPCRRKATPSGPSRPPPNSTPTSSI